ncbi:hypothetical protein FHS57_000276 [Runella defluvii]|uniref:DUF4402 domain-containing protein n=1 Tax=Runella defluvii TaxID=370973 RepID=A0A7W6ENB3_9BACT|nr:hypothetical protein [Runella defluvii]MBB3836294.1 hypothetical protein [Runella defluvii]
MFKKLFAIAALVSIGSGALYAQAPNNTKNHNVTITVPDVALLKIEGADPTLAVVAPTVAGDPVSVTGVTNSDKSLQYSSTVATSGGDMARTITAAITAGTVPSGFDLKVSAVIASGGDGAKGTAIGTPFALTGTAQNIVTAIGSCYTGTAAGNGAVLTYALAFKGAYADIRYNASDVITVTYTLSDN